MKNLKVSVKLLMSFAIVIVLAIVVGVVGILGMQQISASDTQMYEMNLLAIKAMGEIRENLQQQRVNIRSVIIFDVGSDEFNDAINKQSLRTSTMETFFSDYEKTINTDDDKASFSQVLDIYKNTYVPLRDKVTDAAKSGDDATAMEYLRQVIPVTSQLVTLFDESYETNVAAADVAQKGTTNLANLMTWVSIIVLVISVIIAMSLGIYIASIIAAPLRFLAKYTGEVAETGNIGLLEVYSAESATHGNRKDEVGDIAKSVNRVLEMIKDQGSVLQRIAHKDLDHYVKLRSDKSTMDLIATDLLNTLNDMLSNMQLSSSQVSSGAKQVADGAQGLAQGSTQQAAAVEQLSASISEVSEKTKENAKMATRAADLGETIKNNAEKGNAQMEQMMQAVKEINDASNSISKVISVIDNIAFQTNILALNAAVEAARAGQHGKGFAVVAEEVRSLASKSADAAKDTSSLIANSMEKAQLGAKIAEETAASLIEIVSGINESGTIVTEIARSSDEQATAISQINNGINQVAQVVQMNSATSEESAAAAEEMSSQSAVLAELAAQFKIRGGMGLPSANKPAVAPRKKQLTMPEKTSYSQPVQSTFDDNDFGKY